MVLVKVFYKFYKYFIFYKHHCQGHCDINTRVSLCIPRDERWEHVCKRFHAQCLSFGLCFIWNIQSFFIEDLPSKHSTTKSALQSSSTIKSTTSTTATRSSPKTTTSTSVTNKTVGMSHVTTSSSTRDQRTTPSTAPPSQVTSSPYNLPVPCVNNGFIDCADLQRKGLSPCQPVQDVTIKYCPKFCGLCP